MLRDSMQRVHSRRFARSERLVSEIGLGCWQLGGGDWPTLDEALALRILHTAHDHGVTFFDTADIYGRGRSERLIGRFLRELRGSERPFVATKLGRMPEPGWPANFTDAVMRRHVDDSLARLGVEALDLIQLHCVPPAELERGDVFATLRALQDAGKVRHYGASVETVAEAELCLRDARLASLQVILNVFRPEPLALFERVRARGVAIIARLPLASGLLAGRWTRDTSFGADDHRSFNADGQCFHVGETFAGLPFARGLELVERLRGILPRTGSLAQCAQRWILDHDAVTTVITGASRPEQVVENAAASASPRLSPGVHAAIAEFHRDHVRAHVRTTR